MPAQLTALLVVLAAVPAQEDLRVVPLADLGLTLTLPPLEELTAAGEGRWHGRLGSSKVEISFATLALEKYDVSEPDEVLDLAAWTGAPARAVPGARRSVAGPFGYAAYASYERSDVLGSDGKTRVGTRFVLGGLLRASAYVLRVEALPPPPEEGESALRAFLEKGIAYDGPVREHRWTDEEARARWLRDAPAETHAKLEDPIRTDHYVILTNSSGGRLFAKKMEECYAAIRAVYPFDEVPGRRLLPVFLFRTADEYYAYYAQITKMKDPEQAKRSKGHAWRDYYATWYEAPGDPVHIHEATHQIFANRLGLGGGGSWFQEGVAEYMSSKPGDRSAIAGQVKKQKHVPLEQFVAIPSLLMSTEKDAPGGDRASDNYDQAALLIEFLRESKWAKDKFPAFLVRVGRLPRGNLIEIQGAIEELYGVNLAELEERWVDYCKKR